MITAYLGKLNEHVMAYLERQVLDLDNVPIEYWITTPATWGNETKCLVRKAALDAGFTAKLTDQIHLASEAEAAALTVFKEFGPALQVCPSNYIADYMH